jgi:tight adherence protein B
MRRLPAAASPHAAVARMWARRRFAQDIDEALPAFVTGIAAAIRAGSSLSLAVMEADVDVPLDSAVLEATSRLRVGAPLEEALAAFADRAGTAQARIVTTALAIGHHSGGDLPRVLDALAEIARSRVRLAREIRASTAQARMSAWVVALLPVAFLFLTGAASREQARLLLGTPTGWALLGAGLTLEGLGILWMRRLGAS